LLFVGESGSWKIGLLSIMRLHDERAAKITKRIDFRTLAPLAPRLK